MYFMLLDHITCILYYWIISHVFYVTGSYHMYFMLLDHITCILYYWIISHVFYILLFRPFYKYIYVGTLTILEDRPK
jgi:hypothetical protein